MKNKKFHTTLLAGRYAAWSVKIASAAAAITAMSCASTFAGAFTPGNLVVERLGNGSQTLTANGNTIFFDEYTTSGSHVQAISIPDSTNGTNAGPTPMVESGTGGTTGSISLTPDGQTLCFPGYATNTNNASSIVSAASTAVFRAIGTLNANGTFTRVATSSAAFSGSNLRGAAGDGENNFWGAGTASSTAVNAGVYYFGTAASASDISSGNYRNVKVYNGQLWYTTASGTVGIYTYSGQPTATSTPVLTVPFASADSDYNFVVSPSGNVIYEADDGGFAASSGGIWKWTGSGTNWTRQYNLLNTGTKGTGCFGLAVNWNTTPPTLYATTTTMVNTNVQSGAFSTIASTNSLIMVQDTGAPTTNVTVLATAGAKTFFRGVSFAPTNATGASAPSITGIFPPSQTVNGGTTVQISVSASGTPPLSNYWYLGSTLVSGPVSYDSGALTLTDVNGGNSGTYTVVVSNATSTATATATVKVIDPSLLGEPNSAQGFADGTVVFGAEASGTGLTYSWYYADQNGNAIAPVTSLTHGSVVSGASSTTPVSGTIFPTLTISNLQAADFPILPTNFLLEIYGSFGNTNSASVSLLGANDLGASSSFATTDGLLAFWNFNGSAFNDSTPPAWYGNGSASLVALPPFVTTVQDTFDAVGGGGWPDQQGTPNNAWGTSGYPAANVSNKVCGVQFLASTVGAKDISLTYDSRVSPTASDYERVQFTTNGGSSWIDYPTSSSFNGHAGTGNGGWLPFANNFTGFSNVANNPNFGVRILTEWQSTATYGAGVAGVVSNGFVGTANTYGTGGTVTYDIVGLWGDAIQGSYNQPSVTGVPNQTNRDSDSGVTNYFTVSGGAGAPYNLTAQSLNVNKINPNFNITQTSPGQFTMVMTPNGIPDAQDAAPILVTATDKAGTPVVTWFDWLLTTIYPPPTNSLVSLGETNIPANGSLTIPFIVGSQSTPVSSFTYSVTSDNNTLIPSGNVVIGNQGTANPTCTITPATGQAGMAQVTVTVTDNNANLSKSTAATFSVMVRPNTNIALSDYFTYDADQQSLDQIPGGYWSHLTGIEQQLQVYGVNNGAYALVDCVNNTENMQALLLGPGGTPFAYSNNTPAVLYASFTINNPGLYLPVNDSSYFMVFNDGTGVTGDYECGLWAVTNGAADGDYRLGIQNFAGNGGEGFAQIQVFPQDLVPGYNYVVVLSLNVSNGQSTLWINPQTESSPSVTDTTTADSVNATLYNIAAIELRESSSEATSENPGSYQVGYLKIGTSFDSVFPALHMSQSGGNVIVNWSDPTLGIQSATDVTGPWTDVTLTPGSQPPFTNTSPAVTQFYRFGH